jgi:hypothetical protein
MSSSSSSDLALYGITWAGGTVVLAGIMQVGKLPVESTAVWKRLLVAALLAAVIVLAVYGARTLEERHNRIARQVAAKHGVRIAAGAAPKNVSDVVRQGIANATALLRQKKAAAASAKSAASSARAGAAAGEPAVDDHQAGPSEAEDDDDEPAAAGAMPSSASSLERQVERDDEAHDAHASESAAVPGMVGGVRRGAFIDRVMPRRVEIAKGYTGNAAGAGKLAEILSYEGMRDIRSSSLYAREAYKTHQWHEPGEGMDQRYTEPSLAGYDPAFAAYAERPFVQQRSTLSGRAPAAF